MDVLRAELCCYGERYESRRQAAYASALELERYELIDEKMEEIPYAAYTTLARARPSSPVVRSLAEAVWCAPFRRPAILTFYALSIIGTPDGLIQQLEQYWGRADRVGRVLYRPLVDRLMRDVAVRQAFEARILDHDSIPARVAMTVPLAESSSLSQRVNEMLLRLLADEHRADRPAGFMYDGRMGEVRAIATVLGELIQLSACAVDRGLH